MSSSLTPSLHSMGTGYSSNLISSRCSVPAVALPNSSQFPLDLQNRIHELIHQAVAAVFPQGCSQDLYNDVFSKVYFEIAPALVRLSSQTSLPSALDGSPEMLSFSSSSALGSSEARMYRVPHQPCQEAPQLPSVLQFPQLKVRLRCY